MNQSFLWGLTALFLSTASYAYLPASAVTTMALPVYGVYTSADPTCVSGFVATVALSKTPQTFNFAAGGAIGSGPVSATIGCVVIVVGNSLSNTWAAGTYTTTSTGGGNTAYPDSNCNAGGHTSGQTICNNGTPAWPAQVTADAAAIGLTLKTTSCSSPSTSDVVPLVLSTNSLCTGQSAVDSTVPACANVNMNNFTIPLVAGDATHGTKLTAPSVAGDLKFIVNPSSTLGGTNNGGGCDNIAAPLFSFSAK